MFNKILVVANRVDSTKRALGKIEHLGKCLRAEILLFEIRKPFGSGLISQVTRPQKEQAEKPLTESRQLSPIAEALTRSGVQASTLYRRGSPAEEIVQAASDAKCDLIAMVTHGRLGPEKMQEQVASLAFIPVIFLPDANPQQLECTDERVSCGP